MVLEYALQLKHPWSIFMWIFDIHAGTVGLLSRLCNWYGVIDYFIS